MLKTYLKIAWRTIVKSRFYSIVNITGLATGLAFTLLTGAYAWNEWQVNHLLKNADRQYTIQGKWKDPNMGPSITMLGYLSRALREQYPNLVANYYRWDGISSIVSKGDKHFSEGLQVGDSTILQMYGFHLIHGDAKTALNDPFSVVITEDKAVKYFGRTNAIGQILSIENFRGSKHDFMVTGVLEDPPKNSITQINDNNHSGFYLSTAVAAPFFGRIIDSWQNVNIISNIELQKGVNAADLEGPMARLMKDNAPPYTAANLGPYAVPLGKYYLDADNGLVRKTIYTLSVIALFILLMAVINFINMCISRSSARMKEIGLRKVLGSLKKQLVAQFLVESIVLVLLATITALGIYTFARPLFGQMLGREIPSLIAFPAWFLCLPFILAFLVGTVAGIYPAFILSSMKSVDSLKGKLKSVNENIWLRKSLVGFQFGTAAVVFIGAIVISQQVRLFFSNDLGYNKEYMLYAPTARDWSKGGVQKMEVIRQQLAAMPELANATLSYEIPNGNNANGVQVYRLGADSATAVTARALVSDNQFASTWSIPMKAGSFFMPVYLQGDSAKIVINETQSAALGWKDPELAVGRQLRIQGSPLVYTVCGVISDFHFGSMRGRISPITYFNVNLATNFRYFSMRLRPGNIDKTITALQKKWTALMPGTPFEYNFMDEALQRVYKTELQLKKASYTATVLAVIIVLLGVIGLVSLSLQKRTREIGIRKIVGASVSAIIGLFMKEFLVIILAAGLIACPAAWFIMHGWLNGYAYRVQLTALPFVLAVSLLGIVTALLITGQTIKVANANPVKSLRTE